MWEDFIPVCRVSSQWFFRVQSYTEQECTCKLDCRQADLFTVWYYDEIKYDLLPSILEMEVTFRKFVTLGCSDSSNITLDQFSHKGEIFNRKLVSEKININLQLNTFL